MAQLFHPSANTISQVSVFGSLILFGGAFGVGALLVRSPYITDVGVVRSQPIPFSHQHHVGDVGIDCQYCHRDVSRNASAGMPTTEICLGCHSQIWADAPILEPLRVSRESRRPLSWVRVHDLPDFVYFNHAIHVSRGLECELCHGRMDHMPLTWRNATLHMEWCLDCHRHPDRHAQPANAVAGLGWERGDREASLSLIELSQSIQGPTHCSACHR